MSTDQGWHVEVHEGGAAGTPEARGRKRRRVMSPTPSSISIQRALYIKNVGNNDTTQLDIVEAKGMVVCGTSLPPRQELVLYAEAFKEARDEVACFQHMGCAQYPTGCKHCGSSNLGREIVKSRRAHPNSGNFNWVHRECAEKYEAGILVHRKKVRCST